MRRRRIAPEAHRSSRRLAHGNLKEISVNAHSFFCYRHIPFSVIGIISYYLLLGNIYLKSTFYFLAFSTVNNN